MNVKNAERSATARTVLIATLVLNWAIAAAKVVFGMLANLSSMVADGFHSFSDGASNILGLIGINIASRPADREHPYGHKKFETFFSLGIAALLFLLCVNFVSEGIRRFLHPVPTSVTGASFAVMIVTLAVNLSVMWYENRVGRRLKSDILVSDAKHTMGDIFTSLSVIAVMIADKFGMPGLDPAATIIIAVFIANAAVSIVKDSAQVLCDGTPALDTAGIEAVVRSVKGVSACHKIRARGREDDIYVDLHVQVDPAMRVDDAHDVSYRIEAAIKEKIPGVADVVVHIEPKSR